MFSGSMSSTNLQDGQALRQAVHDLLTAVRVLNAPNHRLRYRVPVRKQRAENVLQVISLSVTQGAFTRRRRSGSFLNWLLLLLRFSCLEFLLRIPDLSVLVEHVFRNSACVDVGQRR